MKQTARKTLLIGIVVALVLALGAVAVFAQSDPATPVPDTDTTPALPGFGGMRGFDHHGGMYGRGSGSDREAELAEALGITVEELQAAQQRAQAARLAQAVEDGTLTQEQANLMLAMQALRGVIDHEALMAQALGLTVEEFAAARAAGTLRDLLANITPAELHASMQAGMTAVVQQAVADNLITQEQADLVLAQMGEGMGFGGMFGRGGHGRGGMHGFGGMHGRGGMGGFGSQSGALETLPGSGA